MKVSVRGFGSLSRYFSGNDGTAELELAEGATVASVLERLSIPEADAWRVTVNSQFASSDYCLQDGDAVSLFAYVGGG
mgnify:CR=1 FL=1